MNARMRLGGRVALRFQSTADGVASSDRWQRYVQTLSKLGRAAERRGARVRITNQEEEEEGEISGRRGRRSLSAERGRRRLSECFWSQTGRLLCSTTRHRCGGATLSSVCTAVAPCVLLFHPALPNHRKAAAASLHKQAATQRFVLLLFLHFALCTRAEVPPLTPSVVASVSHK